MRTKTCACRCGDKVYISSRSMATVRKSMTELREEVCIASATFAVVILCRLKTIALLSWRRSCQQPSSLHISGMHACLHACDG